MRNVSSTEGDYNILESGIYYDIHAVAGLLKLWLRELPTEVLTVELHNDFLCVIGNLIISIRTLHAHTICIA